jgi:hypothetical protein
MPSMEKLTELVERSERVLLTVVDADGHPHTCPLPRLKVPFQGHIWFRVRTSSEAALAIGRGSEVSVACGDAAHGAPGATLYGWAVALRDPSRTSPSATSLRDSATVLVCVTANAAELWNEPVADARRVIAFANAVPQGFDGRIPQAPAFKPALARAPSASCIS